jgi:hypothetical protein
MTVRPVVIEPDSPFIGEACALCKEGFLPGDQLIICPLDAVRHHRACWEANGNKCTAYGCTGEGEIGRRARRAREQPNATVTVLPGREGAPASRVKVMPARSFSCAQSCLVLAIALAIVLVAVGCFGLWAIVDYIVIELLGWQYREPLSAVPWPDLELAARHAWLAIA